MIGFKLTATSNTAYKRNYEQWTEGDFWISDAIGVMSKMPGLGLGGKIIEQGSKSKDVINAAFSGLLGGALEQLSGVSNQMGVTVSGAGDTFLSHSHFNINGFDGVRMVERFVLDLKRTSEAYNQEIGDQVMLQIVKTIKEFDLKMPRGTVGMLWIEIEF